MNKVENCIDPNASNPLQAISTIMSSGLINELVNDMGQGIENGSLNLNSLMGTVQTMVSGMGGASGGEGAPANPLGGIDMTSITSMMQQMMSNGGTGGTPGEMPDMAGLLGTLMSSMGGMNVPTTRAPPPTRMREPPQPKIEDDVE